MLMTYDDEQRESSYLDTYIEDSDGEFASGAFDLKELQAETSDKPTYSANNAPRTLNGVYLSVGEIRNNIQKYRETGDKAYRDKVILSNLDLVHCVIHRNKFDLLAANNGSFSYDDIFQAGVAGLIRAIDRYDVDMGTAFTTYAYYWVRQSVLRCITNMRGVRLPVHVREVINKLLYIRTVLQEAGVEPTCEALSKEIGLTEEYISSLLLYDLQLVSLDAPVQGEGNRDTVLGDFLADDTVNTEQKATENFLYTALMQVVGKFTGRTYDIICMRLGVGVYSHSHSLQEIADKYELSRERIRQIIGKCLRKMRYDKQIREVAMEYGYALTDDATETHTAYWTYNR